MNNNRVKIVRGNIEKLLRETDKVPYGQPVFLNDKRYLVVGKREGDTREFSLKSIKPITVRDILGYFDDNDELTANKTLEYKVVPTDTELLIESSKDILVKVAENVYARFNTTRNEIAGATKIANLFAESIKGDGDIIVVDSNKKLKVNRAVEQSKDVQFLNDAAVKSKFIAYGSPSSSANVFVLETAEGKAFLTNSGTSQFDKLVTIGKSGGTSKILSVIGNAEFTGIISVPTIKTNSSSSRVEISQNSGNPYVKVMNGTNVAVELTKSQVNANVAVNASDIIIAGDLTMDADNKKAKIKTAEIDTLTVKTLVIN